MASVYKNNRGTWDVAWIDSSKKRRYKKGLATRALAEAIGERNEFRKSAAKAGLISRADEKHATHADEPLPKHLDDFFAAQIARGDTELHATATRRLIERVFKSAGCDRIDQIDRDKIRTKCANLPPINGKEKLSIGSQNKALASCKSFTAWLFDSSKIDRDPLARLATRDAEREPTRRRLTLSPEQCVKLFETTKLQKTRGGMRPLDRAMRYAMGFGTGLRQGTLFALKVEDIDLDELTITIPARIMKGRKAVIHPITRDLAEVLRPWLKEKKRGQRLFDKLPFAKPIKTYRHDLKAAGIQYHETGTNLYCDLHAQRNTFITQIIRSGGLAVAQDLAHHSTPVLTAKYARLEMSDYAKALDGLTKLGKTQGKKRKSG
jgi:site-specific recombinase XerC